jgi:hypothetical protein
LKEAAKHSYGIRTSCHLLPQMKRIEQMWKANSGVVVLRLFDNITSPEALTREAAMMAALGRRYLDNTNRSNNFNGPPKNWGQEKRNDLGCYLIYRALEYFRLEGLKKLSRSDAMSRPSNADDNHHCQ